MTRTRVAACVLPLVLLVGAACGGDADTETSEARDPTTTSSLRRAVGEESGPSRDGGRGERVGVDDEVRITVED